jgi:2-dehydro-3-deoxyphosphogluconate aldolase / (4S)-4-hydroxy-2-oxoglutarate aldolase
VAGVDKEFAVINAKTRVRMRIEEFAIVPSLRPLGLPTAADDTRFAAESLFSAGIPIVEISMSIPGAINVISDLAYRFPKMIVGADVLDLETARRCLDVGIKFLTSPGLFLDIVEFATAQDVVIFPGAFTATEVVAAWNAGSDYVKVFPCSPVGGASYVKALRGPLPDVPLIAAGGVSQQNARNFIAAGATAVGVGTELVPQEALQRRNDAQIHELTRRFLAIVKEGRNERLLHHEA